MINRNVKILNRPCFGLAIVLFFPGTTAHAIERLGEADVIRVQGNANYSNASGTGGVLKAGKTLNVDDAITTAARSEVNLDFRKNGGLLRIRQGSNLRINKLDIIDNDVVATELFLARGSIAAKVKKVSEMSTYEIKTPNCVATIRGGEFAIFANGTVTVLAGTVEVAYVYPSGRSAPVPVRAGQTLEYVPAGVTPKPRASTPMEVR